MRCGRPPRDHECVTTHEHVVAVGHTAAPARSSAVFESMMDRVAGWFYRVETRSTARALVSELVAPIERKTCWQLAEHAGHARPERMQRLLRTAVWDAHAVRDEELSKTFDTAQASARIVGAGVWWRRSTKPDRRACVMSAQLPGCMAPQNNIRPSRPVRTMVLTAFCLLFPEVNRSLSARPAAGRRTRISMASRIASCLLVPRWLMTSANVDKRRLALTMQPRSASSGQISPTARVMVERSTSNHAASTSCVVACRRCTNVASSRSTNTSLCLAPAPSVRCRVRADNRACCRACQTGPSSATRSANASVDKPVTRR